MATVKENLIAAKALIDMPEKWRKDPSSREKSCCAIVATNRVTELDQGGKEAGLWAALYSALPPHWRLAQNDTQHGWRVGEFNDHPDTTHSDIMALFQRAIDAQDAIP